VQEVAVVFQLRMPAPKANPRGYRRKPRRCGHMLEALRRARVTGRHQATSSDQHKVRNMAAVGLLRSSAYRAPEYR